MHHKILSPKWRLFSRGRWVRSCNHLPLWIASSFFPHLQKHQLEPKHCPLSSPLTQKGPNGAKLNRPTGLLFGFWMAWFRQRNSSLLWNFSFKFHVHVLCGCRQKPNDCQLCRFQNGCLVILNNVQLQSTHCPLPPSPMGRVYPSRSLICNF